MRLVAHLAVVVLLAACTARPEPSESSASTSLPQEPKILGFHFWTSATNHTRFANLTDDDLETYPMLKEAMQKIEAGHDGAYVRFNQSQEASVEAMLEDFRQRMDPPWNEKYVPIRRESVDYWMQISETVAD